MKSLVFSVQIVLFISFSEQICQDKIFFITCTSLEDLSSSTDFRSLLDVKPPENATSQFAELKQVNSQFLHKIQTLQIRGLINDLSMEAFKNFQNLKIIFLEDNKINHIERGVFKNLNITQLNLEANSIKFIDTAAFENLSHLSVLNLNNNNLTSIKTETFVNLPIIILKFSNNQIKEIEHRALVNLPKLDTLHLDGNYLNEFIATEVLDMPENIYTLNLGHNKLMEITTSMLEGLKLLYNLQIDHNVISRIEPKSFDETPELKVLDLSYNQLSTLDSGIFPNRGLEYLRDIRLDHNRLTFLPSKILNRLPNLEYIKIGGNPWQCACLDIILYWLELRTIDFGCDEENFYSGKRPACVVPDGDDARVCLYNYDVQLWTRYHKFYSKYPPSINCKVNWFPIRLWVGVMIFFTTFVTYMIRVNMSLSLVAMVTAPSGPQHEPECKSDRARKNEDIVKSNKDEPHFEWDEHTQGLILAAYFYGYITTSLPAGIVAEWLGAWKVIFISFLLQAIINGLIIVAARHHWSLVFLARFFIGNLSGLIYPAVQCLISRWSPPKEKGRFMMATMGNSVGTFTTFPFIGLFTEYWGWEWGIFSVTIVLLVFTLVFFLLVSDSPAMHRMISTEEQNFIRESQEGHVSSIKKVPPYIQILTSAKFWALAAAHFGNIWGIILLSMSLPKYFVEVLGYDLHESGFLSSLPYIGRFVFSLIFGIIGDYVQKNSHFSKTTIRKSFVFISHILAGCTFFLFLTVQCNSAAVITFLFVNQCFNSAVVVSHLLNCQDLSPNFAGTIFGLMNFVGCLSGFIVPAITGALTQEKNGFTQWQYIFVISGLVYVAGGLTFIFFGTAELQSWNDIPETEE